MIRHPAQRAMLLEPRSVEATSASTPSNPWINTRDIGVAGLITLLGLKSWCSSERKWLTFAQKVVEGRLRRSAGLSDQELATFRVIVGDRPSSWIEERFRPAWLSHKYNSWMQLLACHRPRSWRPAPRLIGREHLDAVVAEKRGALLLTANFVYQDLMGKAALSQAGFAMSHLFRDTHGFFESRLGQRLLNPIYTSIESRFLKDRLVFRGTKTRDVNALIKAKLGHGELVSIKVTPLGKRTLTLPFLFGQITIATGALNFACETDAAILPVFTIRKPNGTVDTIIEPEISRLKAASRSEMIEAILQDYVPRLEMYVAQYPEQFSFPSSDQRGELLIKPWERAADDDRHANAVPRRRIAEPV